jgi:hypothetical protein
MAEMKAETLLLGMEYMASQVRAEVEQHVARQGLTELPDLLRVQLEGYEKMVHDARMLWKRTLQDAHFVG